MKTFKELEEIGIVGMFRDDGFLKVITKDSCIWLYLQDMKLFEFNGNL